MMKSKTLKLIIVANRLPVKGVISNEMIRFERSARGLATIAADPNAPYSPINDEAGFDSTGYLPGDHW